MSTVEGSRFSLGRLVATPAALDALKASGQGSAEFINRHRLGDWGDVDPQDKVSNDEAIANEGKPELQGRVLSAYMTRLGVRIWIITEWDRSVTTLLLPEDY